jgi:predicted alpha/beta hydrolase
VRAVQEPQKLTFQTSDGVVLTGTLFGAVRPGQPAVLVGSALGIAQNFYAPFASWLTQRGYGVMTFDVRGIGASRTPGQSLRAVKADLLTWAQQDFAAAVQTLCVRAQAPQITVLGHSLGAHHPAMSGGATQAKIRKLVSIAGGAGYWRDWAAPSRKLAPLMLHVAGPLLTPLLGYFPGKRLGMVGDLPAGVMRQWSRWCRHPQFAWGAQPELLLPVLATVRYPIHAIGLTDDEAITEVCIRKLLEVQPHAPATLDMVTPQSMGVQRIGHLGAFRRDLQAQLWPHIAQCLA